MLAELVFLAVLMEKFFVPIKSSKTKLSVG